jgi:hypothetical protein
MRSRLNFFPAPVAGVHALSWCLDGGKKMAAMRARQL